MSHQLLVVVVLLSACYILAEDAKASGSGSRKRKSSGKAVLTAEDEAELKMYQDFLLGSEFTLPDLGDRKDDPVELSSEDEKMEDDHQEVLKSSAPKPYTENPQTKSPASSSRKITEYQNDPTEVFLDNIGHKFPQFKSNPMDTNAYWYMCEAERRYWQNK